MSKQPTGPGQIILFGSGETGKHGRRIQEEALAVHPKPVRVSILETPAGFQPNVDVVTGKLKTFYEHNLQNLKPIVTAVPARKRGGAGDPDDPAVANLLADADVIAAGPGSPTYMINQLQGSLTLQAMRNRLANDSTLVFASAAAIAVGQAAIPVYEIFKVGDDPRWVPGLDLLADIGLHVAVVPHWNNTEGGVDLDTSHCFIGADRFASLREALPGRVSVVGIDEHTAIVIEPASGVARVLGAGNVTTIVSRVMTTFPAGSVISISQLSG